MLVPLFSIVIKLEGPLQVPLKVKVKVRSGQVRSGQVRSDSNANSNSKVVPELYTKIGFHHSPLTHTISKWVFREENVWQKLFI